MTSCSFFVWMLMKLNAPGSQFGWKQPNSAQCHGDGEQWSRHAFPCSNQYVCPFLPPPFLLKFFLSTIDTPKTDCLHVMWIKMYSKAVRAWNVSLSKGLQGNFLANWCTSPFLTSFEEGCEGQRPPGSFLLFSSFFFFFLLSLCPEVTLCSRQDIKSNYYPPPPPPSISLSLSQKHVVIVQSGFSRFLCWVPTEYRYQNMLLCINIWWRDMGLVFLFLFFTCVIVHWQIDGCF